MHDFGKSWRSGLAFSAMIKSINPDLVDLRESFSSEPRENIEQAFMIAHESLDIPPLLEPEGKCLLDVVSPSQLSIFIHKTKYQNDLHQDSFITASRCYWLNGHHLSKCCRSASVAAAVTAKQFNS